jgi:HPt (histidine-containing phosphotransfer) domain-containing protein
MNAVHTASEPLYSTLGGDPDLVEIVALFVDEMPARISAIATLLADGNWDDLRRAAHQLKGSAGSYGFPAISPLAAKVEDDVRNGQPEEAIRAAVDDLLGLCDRVRAGAPA